MTLLKGRNVNTNDDATVEDLQAIPPATNTAVTVLPANPDRMYFFILVQEEAAFIRFMPASEDASTRKGILLEKEEAYEMPVDNIYIGEISIINKEDGKESEYFVTEY